MEEISIVGLTYLVTKPTTKEGPYRFIVPIEVSLTTQEEYLSILGSEDFYDKKIIPKAVQLAKLHQNNQEFFILEEVGNLFLSEDIVSYKILTEEGTGFVFWHKLKHFFLSCRHFQGFYHIRSTMDDSSFCSVVSTLLKESINTYGVAPMF
jgi:hypothetical protein